MWLRTLLLTPLAMLITFGIFVIMTMLIARQQGVPSQADMVFEWGRTKIETPPPKERERKIEPPKKSKSRPAQTARVATPQRPSRPVSPVGTAPVVPANLVGKTFSAPKVGNLSLNTGFSGDGQSDIQAVKRFEPVYPSEAISQLIEGYVVLEFTISEKGVVSDVLVLEAEPKGVFESEAVAAIKKWVFTPKKIAGKAVDSRARQRVEFGFVDG